MPPHKDINELRRCMDMVNQLGQFLPHLADLIETLSGLHSTKNAWYWGEAQTNGPIVSRIC